jgi:hypothetical protein
MSMTTPHQLVLRALSRAFHRAAEERMERSGSAFPDEGAARVLGSMAQAFEWAADELHAHDQQTMAALDHAKAKGR